MCHKESHQKQIVAGNFVHEDGSHLMQSSELDCEAGSEKDRELRQRTGSKSHIWSQTSQSDVSSEGMGEFSSLSQLGLDWLE